MKNRAFEFWIKFGTRLPTLQGTFFTKDVWKSRWQMSALALDRATLTERKGAAGNVRKTDSVWLSGCFHPLVTILSVKRSSISHQLIPPRSTERCYRPSFVLTAIQLQNASSHNTTSNPISRRQLGSYRELLCHSCMICLPLLSPSGLSNVCSQIIHR